MTLRHAPLLWLGLLMLACTSDVDGGSEAGPLRAAQLHGASCAPVGATARLTVDVRGGEHDAASFRVLSVGCAPSCSAALGEGDVIAIRSDLEGAVTVQAVVRIEDGTPPPQTVTTARVVQFVGSGACEADGGANEDGGFQAPVKGAEPGDR